MAKQDQDVPGRAQEMAEVARTGSLCIVTAARVVSVPQAPGSWAQAGRVPPVLVCDALRAAEMLGKEMQLVGGGLVRQLMQPLLGGRGRLQGRTDTGGQETGRCLASSKPSGKMRLEPLSRLETVTGSTRHRSALTSCAHCVQHGWQELARTLCTACSHPKTQPLAPSRA